MLDQLGAAPGEKKWYYVSSYFPKTKILNTFLMPFNKNLTSGMSKHIYLLYFSNIMARMSAFLKI